MKPISLCIAEELGVREQQVAAAISLLDGGATVPFVARYRKGLIRGIRTGVKVAVVTRTGQVAATATIYPHEPQRRWD
jgi:uncharacterized protein